MENIRDSSRGKMCPEHSRQTAAKTSKPSSKASVPSKKIKLIFLDMRNGRMPEKSWQTITQSHGGFSTLNTGEFPNECARLQGFPDGWCKNLETENPTDEEIAFWKDVFETH